MARSYQAGWLRKDVVAGLILTALLVPQGMAYAELAGLPPITGLYTSILCLAAYAVFGPSRVLVLGPDSALGPMIAACIIPLVAANGDPGKAVAYASILALMVGAITVLAGVFQLGFVADLLSKPTQIGYMNGLARDHHHRSAAQAVRLLGRRRRPDRRRPPSSSAGVADGQHGARRAGRSGSGR